MATKTNISINGKEYYRITRTVGHRITDGKKVPVKKQFYGKSKGDAEKQYKAYIEEQARLKFDRQYALDNSTLHERAADYIESTLKTSSRLATGTKLRYQSSYAVHIEGTWLDDMIVKDIHASDIQRFYNEADVTMSTLRQINRFMSGFYKWMVRNEYAYDVIAAIELPMKPERRLKEDIVIWDDEAWDRLTCSKFDFRHDFLIKMLSYTGMRIGEALGLKYSDIQDDVIHIARQYQEGELKDPKAKSKRDIPLHPKLITGLEEHRREHEAEMKRRHYQTDFVFTTPYGTLYDYSNLRNVFYKFYDKEGFERNGFHVYRSTFCTKLCEAGVPIEVASKLLGHKSLEVTAAHYALVRKEKKADAIALLK